MTSQTVSEVLLAIHARPSASSMLEIRWARPDGTLIDCLYVDRVMLFDLPMRDEWMPYTVAIIDRTETLGEWTIVTREEGYAAFYGALP